MSRSALRDAIVHSYIMMTIS